MRCSSRSPTTRTQRKITSDEAYDTARYCLMDTLACGFQALKYPACTKLLGPVVPGASMPGGARVPGTSYELDPVQAAFNIGAMVRWLDFNDTWLAAEWGHPSDNLGGILAVADYLARKSVMEGEKPLTVRDVLTAMIKAHEIQGVLALENSFNRVGLDHVMLVRVASTAVVTAMLGGTREQIINAVSNAWIDGGALRTYRHAPNTGSRKSWAAGDATTRAVRHALIALTGEMGYPSALSAQDLGLLRRAVQGQAVLAAAAVRQLRDGERAVQDLLPRGVPRADGRGMRDAAASAGARPRSTTSSASTIETQEPGVRIIDKTGPLANPADRDHCIQYMVAVPLIFGRLTAEDYEDAVATRSAHRRAAREDAGARERRRSRRNTTRPDKRSIGNAMQVFFRDGTSTPRVQVDFPIGHRKRRAEGMPVLVKKFETSVAAHFTAKQTALITRDLRRPARSSTRCRSTS